MLSNELRGKKNFSTPKYQENTYGALSANGCYDDSIDEENDFRNHLLDIGFSNYVSHICEARQGDNPHNYIWVQVEKSNF